MTNPYEHLDIVTNQEAVEQFVERLATFDRADWLSVAASVTQTGHTASSRARLVDPTPRRSRHGTA